MKLWSEHSVDLAPHYWQGLANAACGIVLMIGKDDIIRHRKELRHKHPEQVAKGWQYSESVKHGRLLRLMHLQGVPTPAVSEGPDKDLTLEGGVWHGF